MKRRLKRIRDLIHVPSHIRVANPDAAGGLIIYTRLFFHQLNFNQQTNNNFEFLRIDDVYFVAVTGPQIPQAIFTRSYGRTPHAMYGSTQVQQLIVH